MVLTLEFSGLEVHKFIALETRGISVTHQNLQITWPTNKLNFNETDAFRKKLFLIFKLDRSRQKNSTKACYEGRHRCSCEQCIYYFQDSLQQNLIISYTRSTGDSHLATVDSSLWEKPSQSQLSNADNTNALIF